MRGCTKYASFRSRACVCGWFSTYLGGGKETGVCGGWGVGGGVINDLSGLFYMRERGLITVKASCTSTAADAVPFRTGLPRLDPHGRMQPQSRHDSQINQTRR